MAAMSVVFCLSWDCVKTKNYLKYTLGDLAFKSVKGLAPSYLCDKFKTRPFFHDRNTRYKDNLNIPVYKSALGHRNFYTVQQICGK